MGDGGEACVSDLSVKSKFKSKKSKIESCFLRETGVLRDRARNSVESGN